MTIGTPVKIKGYDVHAVVINNNDGGGCIEDANGNKYFCFESELVTSTKKLVKQ